ncbi:hypothetical protein, partial [Pseudoalteromonas denitrificans]
KPIIEMQNPINPALHNSINHIPNGITKILTFLKAKKVYSGDEYEQLINSGYKYELRLQIMKRYMDIIGVENIWIETKNICLISNKIYTHTDDLNEIKEFFIILSAIYGFISPELGHHTLIQMYKEEVIKNILIKFLKNITPTALMYKFIEQSNATNPSWLNIIPDTYNEWEFKEVEEVENGGYEQQIILFNSISNFDYMNKTVKLLEQRKQIKKLSSEKGANIVIITPLSADGSILSVSEYKKNGKGTVRIITKLKEVGYENGNQFIKKWHCLDLSYSEIYKIFEAYEKDLKLRIKNMNKAGELTKQETQDSTRLVEIPGLVSFNIPNNQNVWCNNVTSVKNTNKQALKCTINLNLLLDTLEHIIYVAEPRHAENMFEGNKLQLLNYLQGEIKLREIFTCSWKYWSCYGGLLPSANIIKLQRFVLEETQKIDESLNKNKPIAMKAADKKKDALDLLVQFYRNGYKKLIAAENEAERKNAEYELNIYERLASPLIKTILANLIYNSYHQ